MDCTNQMQQDHIRELADTNARVNALEHQVSDLTDMKENLKLLTHISKEQSENIIKSNINNEQQIKINTEFKMTLDNINENLTSMNSKVNELENKSSISILDIVKKSIIWLVGVGACTVIFSHGKELISFFTGN